MSCSNLLCSHPCTESPFLSFKESCISMNTGCDSYQAKCGSTDPCVYTGAAMPAYLHESIQERGNLSHNKCHLCQCRRNTWFLPSGGWYLCSNIQLKRRQGFVGGGYFGGWGGGDAEWFRVWYGVQWWRIQLTPFHAFLQTRYFFSESQWQGSRMRKMIVIWGRQKRGDNERRGETRKHEGTTRA